MLKITRVILPLAVAAAVTAGCGSNNETNPFRNFGITDELVNHIYVYDFDDSKAEIRYDSARNLVYGVNRSTDQTIGVGFFGPPINDSVFSITTATTDTNGDGDFFTNEPPIPLTAQSIGTFSDTGETLELQLSLEPGVFNIDFSGVGDLTDIRTTG